MPGRRKASASQHSIEVVDHGSDVKVLVRIAAADDAAFHLLIHFHANSPGSTACGRLHRDRMPGQDSNVTERQALLGSRASARQNLAARHPGRPTGPGKDTDRGRSEWGPDQIGRAHDSSHANISYAVFCLKKKNV